MSQDQVINVTEEICLHLHLDINLLLAFSWMHNFSSLHSQQLKSPLLSAWIFSQYDIKYADENNFKLYKIEYFIKNKNWMNNM